MRKHFFFIRNFGRRGQINIRTRCDVLYVQIIKNKNNLIAYSRTLKGKIGAARSFRRAVDYPSASSARESRRVASVKRATALLKIDSLMRTTRVHAVYRFTCIILFVRHSFFQLSQTLLRFPIQHSGNVQQLRLRHTLVYVFSPFAPSTFLVLSFYFIFLTLAFDCMHAPARRHK